MPWQETRPMDQRERFIEDERLALYSMTELCARYGVSRKTGYKWLAPLPRMAGVGSGTRAARRTTVRTGSDARWPG